MRITKYYEQGKDKYMYLIIDEVLRTQEYEPYRIYRVAPNGMHIDIALYNNPEWEIYRTLFEQEIFYLYGGRYFLSGDVIRKRSEYVS